jgi:hypothetical protein
VSLALLRTAKIGGDVPPAKKAEPGSPHWWLRRLHMNIVMRHPALIKLQRYYDGEFNLQYADARLKEVFGQVFYADRFGMNFMGMAVDAVGERLHVDGMRVGDEKGNDTSAWQMWQDCQLDELSTQVHLESMINGVSYVTVWPSDDGDDPSGPVDITLEHPMQAIVELHPKLPRRRLAGLRLWVDEYGYLHAELFLPDEVHLFVSLATKEADWRPETMTWVYDTSIGNMETGVLQNTYGVVPIVPFYNLPRLALTTTTVARDVAQRSELWRLMPVQDVINSVLFNTVLAANEQGFRQRWVTGLELDIDPQTGKAKEPFKAGIDRLWQAENPAVKFGDFSPTDIAPLVGMIDQIIHSFGSIAQVPPHYFSAHADRMSGESIKSAESALISKVRRRQVTFGDAWEEVMRLAGRMTDNAALAQANAAETIWRNPEVRSEAQMADAALKRAQVGVPWRQVMAYLGYSPQAIEEMEQARAEDALLTTLQSPAALTSQPPAQPPLPPGGPTPPPVPEPDSAAA